MPNYNPGFPHVLGNELMLTRDQKTRIFYGANARMARYPSTVTETITALGLSLSVDPMTRESIPILIDVMEEGNEFPALPKLAQLVPNSDRTNGGWERHTGATTNIFQSIDDSTETWPNPNNPAQTQWILTKTPATSYTCGVDASLFGSGGAAENGRIYWVGVAAIIGANRDFRRLGVRLEIDGVLYPPAGGHTRDVNYFGERWEFYWGEINPATNRPWTPAEIAKFGTQTDWGIRFNSAQQATPTHYPQVYAASLNVQYSEVENRAAVGVWRRPESIGANRLINIETDTLRSVPTGTSNWSKASGRNYLVYPRQSVSPAVYGPTVAPDVRWNGGIQDLGPGGQPPGVVYPLSTVSEPPAPASGLASRQIGYDIFGRPQEPFNAATVRARPTYAIAFRRSDATHSVDSQPYRIDLADVVFLNNATGITGQRLTPSSAQDYLGVRLPVIPLGTGPGTATLTVRVHRVSTGAQIGGTFSITKAAVRALPQGHAGIRYVVGFLSAGASLLSGVQYEVRIATDSVSGWHLFAPDCSLAPTRGFGGTTNGAMINGAHNTNRDFAVNLIRQPDPPTAVTASIVNVPVNVTYVAQQVPTVEHVGLSWVAPAVSMGALFSHYEIERSLDDGPWQRIANARTEATTALPNHDREVDRNTAAKYRVRAVGKDGRISQWAESNEVTPTAPGLIVVITSNHEPDWEVVYFYDRDSVLPILSNGRDETVMMHGEDNQVVFMEAENRGIGFRTDITINQVAFSGKGGVHVLTPLLRLIRPAADGSLPVPYVCVMDNQGTKIMGHVSVDEVPQRQPQHIYRAQMDAVPTHSAPVPVEIP